jgi:hypothetical protein
MLNRLDLPTFGRPTIATLDRGIFDFLLSIVDCNGKGNSITTATTESADYADYADFNGNNSNGFNRKDKESA